MRAVQTNRIGERGGLRWTPLLRPRDAVFKLAFFEAAQVVVSCSLFRASIHFGKRERGSKLPAALPLHCFWSCQFSAAGALIKSGLPGGGSKRFPPSHHPTRLEKVRHKSKGNAKVFSPTPNSPVWRRNCPDSDTNLRVWRCPAIDEAAVHCNPGTTGSIRDPPPVRPRSR